METKQQITLIIGNEVACGRKVPSIRFIANQTNKSISTIYQHLEEMGWADGKGWWIENKKEVNNKQKCPCCGRKYN